ncbi:hypothetical protein [Nitrosomonas ureae]|uniref:Uncharacterized protein n=1 Tax=Nitrosomonas ureae TaxID=44577 RepID=A0A1H9BL19_9PROT|nr:hypothetical protein [Nitrosomonas ureae]PTQ87341.1 hypothetical protein C8R28_1006103 [Nitrosomonas ureae]SEP89401.1 hypothetical protein SAMN05421510_10095 [Nitrosomonas ureae]
MGELAQVKMECDFIKSVMEIQPVIATLLKFSESGFHVGRVRSPSEKMPGWN